MTATDQTTTQRTYPHGATCWVDTSQPDAAAARHFYGELLGWTFPDTTDPYCMATVEGRDAAAIKPSTVGTARWHTYVAVDDADATAKAIADAGGAVLDPPRDMGPAGRGARCADPQGAQFHLWQPGDHVGAQHANDHGGWVFSDLWTPHRAAALAFYGPLFGWIGVEAGAWTMLQLPGYAEHLAATVYPDLFDRLETGAPEGFGDVTAGMVADDSGAAPRWHVTFAVDDRDQAAARAERLGGTVVSTSRDPWTKQALVRDPQGALLSLSQYDPAQDR